jgi:hypothetical protein
LIRFLSIASLHRVFEFVYRARPVARNPLDPLRWALSVVHFRLGPRLQHALELLQGDMRRIPQPHPELRTFHPTPRHRQIAVLKFPVGVNCLFERDVLWVCRMLHPVVTRLFSARSLWLFFYLFSSTLLSYMASA